jgi:hypothetical protein
MIILLKFTKLRFKNCCNIIGPVGNIFRIPQNVLKKFKGNKYGIIDKFYNFNLSKKKFSPEKSIICKIFQLILGWYTNMYDSIIKIIWSFDTEIGIINWFLIGFKKNKFFQRWRGIVVPNIIGSQDIRLCCTGICKYTVSQISK